VDPGEVSGRWFSMTDEGVSVYEVNSDIQETAVAAAILAGRDTTLKEPLYLLRILPEELSSRKLEVTPTEGDTGVGESDQLHRDILSKPKACEDLTRHLLSRLEAGEDRVRAVYTPTLVWSFERFQGMTKQDIHPKSRKRAEKYIVSAAKTR